MGKASYGLVPAFFSLVSLLARIMSRELLICLTHKVFTEQTQKILIDWHKLCMCVYMRARGPSLYNDSELASEWKYKKMLKWKERTENIRGKCICRCLWSPVQFFKPSNHHLNNPVPSKLLSIASLLSLCPGAMLASWVTLSYKVPYEHVPNAILSAKAAGSIFSAICVRESVHTHSFCEYFLI